LHYGLVVTDFPFSPAPLFNPVSQKRLWFFGGNVCVFKLQGFLLLQRGLIMLSFSEAFFLKTTRPIALISLLVFHVQKSDGGAHRHDCLNCKHQPNVCKFLLVLEAQILDNSFSSSAEKCRSKTFSILSIPGFALCATPSLHHHFIIQPVLFILCLIDVQRVISSDYSSCIYHPFIYQSSNLFM
jgi:hypothetical protein